MKLWMRDIKNFIKLKIMLFFCMLRQKIQKSSRKRWFLIVKVNELFFKIIVVSKKLIELQSNFKANCNFRWNELNFTRIESILEFGKQRTIYIYRPRYIYIYIYNKMVYDIEYCSTPNSPSSS